MMPVYNGEKLVHVALESVASQTYRNTQMVLYNDGSTDNTVAAIDRWFEEHPDKRTIPGGDARAYVVDGGENKGLPAADNGIRKFILEEPVEGEYIAWLAADDQWRFDKIEQQLKYMNRNPDIDICYTDSVFILPDGKAKHAKAPDFDINLLYHVNYINGSSVMMRRIVLETLSWNEEYQNCEDWDYWLRCHSEGFKFGRLGEDLVANLRHSGNISNDRSREAYFHAKVAIAHGLPIEVCAMRMINYRDPSMIKGIYRAWREHEGEEGARS
jgi:glycosyltransferase involved in cell wall biosynthesis